MRKPEPGKGLLQTAKGPMRDIPKVEKTKAGFTSVNEVVKKAAEPGLALKSWNVRVFDINVPAEAREYEKTMMDVFKGIDDGSIIAKNAIEHVLDGKVAKVMRILEWGCMEERKSALEMLVEDKEEKAEKPGEKKPPENGYAAEDVTFNMLGVADGGK